jgi:hypothetical protein
MFTVQPLLKLPYVEQFSPEKKIINISQSKASQQILKLSKARPFSNKQF